MDKRGNVPYYKGESHIYKIDGDHIDLSPTLVQRYFGGSRYVAQPGSKQRIAAGIQRAKLLVKPMGMTALYRVDSLAPNGRLLLGRGKAITCPSESLADDIVGVAAGLRYPGAGSGKKLPATGR